MFGWFTINHVVCFYTATLPITNIDCSFFENSKTNPLSLYARTKIASERVLSELGDSRFTPIFLRFGTVYGFSGRTRFDLVVNTMTRFALETKRITVHNPKLWRPLIDIRDIVLSYINSIESDLEVSGVYNISQNKTSFC